MKNEKHPRVVVGDYPRSGKSLGQIQDLIRIIKKLDNTKTSPIIAESYNQELQKLSHGRIGLRYWTDWNNLLRCVIVYPNSIIKELCEWW